MSDPQIQSELHEQILTLRLNRPARLNALTPQLADELIAALTRAGGDDAVRAIVLTGNGRAFCAGADLDIMNVVRDAQGRIDLGAHMVSHYNPLALAVRAVAKPVIASVNGVAAGGGFALALLADLVIAARSAPFVVAFPEIALIPDIGATWSLPRRIGAQRTMGLALLGGRLSAEQARDWGLVWDVVDDAQLPAATLALAQKLAAGPTQAFQRARRAIDASVDNTLSAQLDLECALQRECGYTADFLEGVSAFAGKRKAAFKGR